MCLIAVAPKGTKKYSDLFLNGIRKAAISNTDGIGYSFKRANTNKVWIAKGFKDVEKFITALKHKRLKDDDELVVHLRIGNKGSKTVDMNHPFVLSNKPDVILENDSYVNGITMCHNGTFHSYSENSSLMSDTYFFVKDFMSVKEIQDFLKRDYKEFAEVFKRILLTNRLAFIFNDNTPMVTLGEFIEDEGYLFSNKTYKEDKYVNVGGQSYYRGHGQSRIDWDNVYDERVTRCTTPALPLGKIERSINFDSADTNNGESLPEIERLQRLQREKVLAEIDRNTASRNLTHIGTRQRTHDHMLIADSKFDIISAADAKAFEDNNSKRLLYPVFGDSLYVPLFYLNSQFESSKFIPREFNYNHFLLMALVGDINKGIPRNSVWEIVYSDDYLKGCHCIKQMGANEESKKVYISTKELITNFSTSYKGKAEDYKTVFKLIQKHPIPSKKLIGRINKVIISSMAKEKKDGITFKELSALSLLGLKIYYNYMTIPIYGEDAWKFIHKVQEKKVNLLVN